MTNTSPDFSPNLSLPFLLPSQAQKHVTVNESLAMIDALMMGAVLSASLSAPPTDPASGSAYIVSETPTGVWSDKAGQLAVWADNAWAFYVPKRGWRVWDEEAERLLVFGEAGWGALTVDAASSIPQFGVNTQSDPANRLSVKSDSVLMSHDDVTPGTGDMRVVINKQSGANVGSVIFQSGWSGQAEIGLMSDSNFAIRSSADGMAWEDALIVRTDNGNIGIGAPPNLTDALAISPRLSVVDGANYIRLSNNGVIDMARSESQPLLIRARSAGSNLQLGVTDTDGNLMSNALIINGDAESLFCGFHVVPLTADITDLGRSGRGFRNCYLTNAPIISSDARGKKNIETFDEGLSVLRSLNPVTFQREGEDGTRHVGLVAQHVREVLDEHALTNSGIWRLSDPEDPASAQAISYSELVPVLIDAVNELAERVEYLEAQS